MSPATPPEALTCPGCGAGDHAPGERFCAACGLPLTHPGMPEHTEPVSAAHGRARKVKKQYAEGDLQSVAGARNQTEAEFIQGLLLEEGVPSMLRRTRGFDVPDMLAAGPRDVMVPASGVAAAREVLLQADLLGSGPASGIDSPGRIAAGLVAGLAVVALILWIGTELLA